MMVPPKPGRSVLIVRPNMSVVFLLHAGEFVPLGPV